MRQLAAGYLLLANLCGKVIWQYPSWFFSSGFGIIGRQPPIAASRQLPPVANASRQPPMASCQSLLVSNYNDSSKILMNMQSVWRESFEVKSYHVDFQQNIKPSALMQLFQEVASNHAAELGWGYNVLIEKGFFWALSRLKVEIIRMPRWDETILFETWPCGLEGLFFRRDFIIYDKDQQVIVRGVSGWLLLAVSTLRPQRPTQLGVELPSNTGKRAMARFPDRIATQTDETIFRKTVAYNEIDQNLHVNNTRYLDWATDCFQLSHYQTNTISDYTLEFLAETHWGDEIELRKGQAANQSAIEAFETSSETLLFRAVITWQKTF